MRFYICIFTISSIMAAPSLIMAQITIKGTLVDKNNEVLPFVNVVLIDATSEKHLIDGTISDEFGVFEIITEKGNYILRTSHLSYESTEQVLECYKNIDLGTIVLTPSSLSLEGVEVRASKPLVTKKVDRLQFNIENTILSEGNTLDVLKRTPGLTVSSNVLQIYGKSGVVVLIDDRPVTLTGEELIDMLNNLSAHNISMVEVITNPPAEYDAEGTGVLNIVTKKNKSPGYRFAARNRFERSVFSKYRHGLSADFKNNVINFYSNYSFGHGKRNLEEFSNINFKDDIGRRFSTWEEYSKQVREFESHNISTAFNWQITSSTNLSTNLEGVKSATPQSQQQSKTEVLSRDGILDSIILNNNELERGFDNWSYSLRLDQQLRGGKDRLTLEGNLIDYKKDNEQVVTTNFLDTLAALNSLQVFTSESKQDINIYYAKVDYNMWLDSTSTLAFGSKYNKIDANNDIVFFDIIQGEQRFDPLRSNTFQYDERVFAAYLSYNKSWSKFEIKGGLRLEHTNTKGFSATLNQTNTNNFLQWFPTASLQYNFKSLSTLGVSYSRRVSRPRFSLLNPFRFFNSPFSFIEGDPFLSTAITDNIELTYDINKQYFLTAFYSQTNSPFTQISLQDNESQVFRFIAVNLDKNIVGGLSGNASFNVLTWWSAFVNSNIYYAQSDFINPESRQAVKNGAISYDLTLNNYITISQDQNLTMEISGRHNSRRVQGGFDLQRVSEVTVGVKKKLLNESATITLSFVDVFDQNKALLRSSYQNQDHLYRENPENQQFQASFLYLLGNQSIGKRKRKRMSDEQKRL